MLWIFWLALIIIAPAGAGVFVWWQMTYASRVDEQTVETPITPAR